MTTILHLEIEHSGGEILSASVSNIKGPVFYTNIPLIPTVKLSTYLQEKESQAAADFLASEQYDDKESKKNL